MVYGQLSKFHFLVSNLPETAALVQSPGACCLAWVHNCARSYPHAPLGLPIYNESLLLVR